MKILFVDTETNGLPLDSTQPGTNFENWPRMIQLAFLIADENGQISDEKSILIQPVDFEIPAKITELTGITQDAAAKGDLIIHALCKLQFALGGTDYLVAHNLDFDIPVIEAEYTRQGFRFPYENKRICTMKNQSIIDYCAIPSTPEPRYKGMKYKWPKLSVLHEKLFGHGFDGAHDALNDVRAMYRCFFRLTELGVILL